MALDLIAQTAPDCRLYIDVVAGDVVALELQNESGRPASVVVTRNGVSAFERTGLLGTVRQTIPKNRQAPWDNLTGDAGWSVQLSQ